MILVNNIFYITKYYTRSQGLIFLINDSMYRLQYKCCLSTIIFFLLALLHVEAKSAMAIIINTDRQQTIFLYYSKTVLEQTNVHLKPQDTLHIDFDANSFAPLRVVTSYARTMKFVSVAVLPGDTVYIKYNKAEDGYDFMGKHAAELAFFKQVGNSDLSLDGPSDRIVSYGSKMPFEDFLSNWYQARKQSEQLIAQLKKTPNVRPEIAAYFEKAHRTRILGSILHPIFPQGAFNAVRPLPQFYQDSVNFYTRQLLQSLKLVSQQSMPENLVYFLRNYTRFITLSQAKTPSHQVMYEIGKKEYDGLYLEWACYFILKDAQEEQQDVSAEVQDFQNLVSTDHPLLKNLLKVEQLNQYPVMDDALLNDNLVSQTGEPKKLLDLVSENKGKVIYIDLWASWCAPCLLELSNSASIRDKYKDKGLVILYFSIDSKREKWHEASDRFLWEEQHSYQLREKESAFLKKFRVKSIPRYLIIDKEGIVRYSAALPLSDPKLEAILEKLL